MDRRCVTAHPVAQTHNADDREDTTKLAAQAGLPVILANRTVIFLSRRRSGRIRGCLALGEPKGVPGDPPHLNILIFDCGSPQRLPAALLANPAEQEPGGRVADAGVRVGFQTGEHGLEGAGITVGLGYGPFQGPPRPPLRRYLVVGRRPVTDPRLTGSA
jgi:hypothetical protein